MNAQLEIKYASRTINTQEEFGDLVECSAQEMERVCIENGWDFSGWKPETLADYLRPQTFCDRRSFERAVRRFADAEDIDTILADA